MSPNSIPVRRRFIFLFSLSTNIFTFLRSCIFVGVRIFYNVPDIFQHPRFQLSHEVTEHRLLRSNPANPELRFDLIKPYLRFVEPERRYFDADTACFELFSFCHIE
ncbi:hypothetical protein TNCV_3427081 [Trichonephila clavipes]|nr:hypothetical protein TNCV_3427081 [Trichonephila clavipes]